MTGQSQHIWLTERASCTYIKSCYFLCIFFYREETVVALVKLGAFAGAVDDPTPLNPGGQTAADLASINGHKGIAGYLAEEDLTSHPSALSGKHKNGSRSREEEQESLAVTAVRRSARAAALIQDAFRARSFRQRKVTTATNEFAEAEQIVALASCSHKVQKSSHYEDYLHVAASRIQQKYRGWKGKNDFKKIRERIVKIQVNYGDTLMLCIFISKIINMDARIFGRRIIVGIKFVSIIKRWYGLLG